MVSLREIGDGDEDVAPCDGEEERQMKPRCRALRWWSRRRRRNALGVKSPDEVEQQDSDLEAGGGECDLWLWETERGGEARPRGMEADVLEI